MSFVGNMFNADQGAGFTASGANVQIPVFSADAQAAGQTVNSALNTQKSMLNSLAANNPIQNQADLYGQQQALANQLQMQAQGQGPNPALAQLAQSTGANTANQAALMAGQRGIGQNAGLIARQAAMQGASNQQGAAGQAATLGAQQQLAAQQMLQNQQGAMGNLASTQVGQQQNALGQWQQGSLQNQANLLGAIANSNNAAVGNQSNVNNVNGSMAGINSQGQWNTFGNVMKSATQGANGISGMMGGMAKGGMVRNYADGGDVDFGSMDMPPENANALSVASPIDMGNNNGPSSNLGKWFQDLKMPAQSQQGPAPVQQQAEQVSQPGISPISNSGGISIPTLANVDWSVGGGQSGGGGGGGGGGGLMKMLPMLAMAANKGAMVPGKASVSGDSLKNDTVDAKLSPGEIVIPRSVVNSKNAPERAAAFVRDVLAKHGKAS